ncbi:NAD dependent epimerase/dehydratase family protein [Halomonas sp. THAF12]|uniref:SDR family oxidoreductase n=1 Tax=Halomonas sp. THAF12 TaxID=2587849 RepID=UPI0012678B2F|nr:SDR family oxidoreductase [Halomonas sp. THAF12]QFT83351.1 NAD dependent epimerase/dehydratase family protein [Halomonas sp. THAF12]
MSQPIKALIAGASGIIGHGVHRALDTPHNVVRGLARHPIDGMDTLCVDLTDPEATRRVIAEQAADTTHLFYAALSPDDDLAVEAQRNAAMLENLLDALEVAEAPLERVVIYQGFKIYGIHLGAKVPTPAREDDPSHLPPNLYQAQEAILTERARSARWDHVVLRPDLMIDGNVHGNPMNIAVVIGVFAALSRELGVPMRYPGTEAAYRVLMQFTDADLLGEASAWAATAEGIAGEAFNITNGDVFRWERLWPEAAEHLGLESASPVPIPLTQHMADKQPVWERIARRHDLVEARLDRLVGWGFGDFIFRTECDVISDVNKIYRYGFTPRCDSHERLLHALDRLRERRVIP